MKGSNILLGILVEGDQVQADGPMEDVVKTEAGSLYEQEASNLFLLDFQSVTHRSSALFLSDILKNQDRFSPLIRRFVQVGETKAERIRNAFELGFEKGFDRVLLFQSSRISAFQPLLQQAADQLLETPLVVIPAENGKVVALGMDASVFWQWSLFDLDEDEVVVEMLAFCRESGIKYALSQTESDH